ncbi:imidazole glycerol phosphate synthase subunit HisH [candidate division KSB1 bacterium]|nr:imidazole glycerol phosphate synthase subunit HisH [candidate division KSB1 bacterium]
MTLKNQTCVTIIDCGVGNLRNLQNAFEFLGATVQIAATPEDIAAATKLILPGVGAFDFAMQQLQQRHLVPAILDQAARGTPLLGICLGMQLLLSTSEEGGKFAGLNLIPGQVPRFQIQLKVPHIGWNTLELQSASPLVAGLAPNSSAYFVHSYYCIPTNPKWVMATTEYKIHFAAIIQREQIFGVQFHPEKSQEVGLTILKNFLEL